MDGEPREGKEAAVCVAWAAMVDYEAADRSVDGQKARNAAMRATDIPETARRSTPEKILLLEDLWDTIAWEDEQDPVPQSHLEELRRRLKRHRSCPGDLLSLEDLQTRIASRR